MVYKKMVESGQDLHWVQYRRLRWGIVGAIMVVVSGILLWRQPEPSTGPLAGYSFPSAPPLMSWTDSRVTREAGESDLEFAERATKVVSDSVFHCSPDHASRLLDRLMLLIHSGSRSQGLLTPPFIRCGYCHQAAYVLARVMSNSGLDARVWGLNGHVVTLVRFDGRTYIADPDFGIGPFEYEAMTPESAIALYASKTGRRIEKPFQTKSDDGEYYSMDRLGEIAEKQTYLIRAGEMVLYVATVAGLLLMLGAALGIRPNRARAKSH